MPNWVWVVVLGLLVVGLVLVARRINRLVDDIQPDASAQRNVTVWLNSAFALRRSGSHSFGTGGGGETLAGPRSGERVTGQDRNRE
jgi:hypothetical protein